MGLAVLEGVGPGGAGAGLAHFLKGVGHGPTRSGPQWSIFSPLVLPLSLESHVHRVPGPWSHVPLSQSEQREAWRGMLVLGTEFQSEGAGAPSPTPSGDHGTLTSLTPRPQVRERDLPFVTHTLSSEFTILRVVNGETVAAENLGITNGFVKPKMGELREGRVVQRDFRKRPGPAPGHPHSQSLG